MHAMTIPRIRSAFPIVGPVAVKLCCRKHCYHGKFGGPAKVYGRRRDSAQSNIPQMHGNETTHPQSNCKRAH
ncbi:MAG: hypothetical protein DCC68_09530 [Planctomycetota bacterium]|nr:MAG: hypothetical protein DCC68_09530 [Planctomycetota bacterium]